jgi:hypothetical protein
MPFVVTGVYKALDDVPFQVEGLVGGWCVFNGYLLL